MSLWLPRDVNREGCCASHLQTGSEKDESEQQPWWNSLLANVTETILPPLLLSADKHHLYIFPYRLKSSRRTFTSGSSSTTRAVELSSPPLKQSPFVHFSLSFPSVCPEQPGSPLVAIRASWLQFWLSRWVLFWSGSSPHLSGCRGEGTCACVLWSSGELPSPAPESESCASFCSPEKGRSPCWSQGSGSSAAQPGGHTPCTSVNTGDDTKVLSSAATSNQHFVLWSHLKISTIKCNQTWLECKLLACVDKETSSKHQDSVFLCHIRDQLCDLH